MWTVMEMIPDFGDRIAAGVLLRVAVGEWLCIRIRECVSTWYALLE